jgi:hypothetical protein
MNYISLKFLFVTLILLATAPATGQQYFEVGLQGGDMPYNGDLSETGLGFLSDWNSFGGFYLRYRPISRVGLRFNGIFGRIQTEKLTEVRISQDERVPVMRNIRTPINEFSLAAEVDLFYLGDPEDRFVAPYIMAGIGHTSFNPQSQREGVYYDLQPLATEGQGIQSGAYDPAPYELGIITYHVGGGVRAKVSDIAVVGLEVSGRVTGTDYLDDITGRRINYDLVLENTTSDGAFFSNPGVTPQTAPDNLQYRRGGDADDFYFLINLTVGVRLGGWGRGGSGCYSF